MIDLSQFSNIYLYREIVDFRKSINGLSQIVADEMEMDPFGSFLFVFVNRNKSRIKILYWDRSGFALWYKRLEKERFFLPKDKDQAVFEIDEEKLRLLLDGYNFWEYKPHKKLSYSQ